MHHNDAGHRVFKQFRNFSKVVHVEAYQRLYKF